MSEDAPIIMYRRGGMLVPHGPMDDEIIRGFDAGRPLRVRLTQARNPRATRFYFAMLSLVRENLPEPAPSVQTLHEAVKVMLGLTLTVKTPRGDIVLPGSINFASMSEPDFHAYLESFMHLLVTRIIPGLDRPAFEKQARLMMGDPIEPARRHAVRDDDQRALPAPDEAVDADFVEVEDDDADPFGAPDLDDRDERYPTEDAEDDGSPFGATEEDFPPSADRVVENKPIIFIGRNANTATFGTKVENPTDVIREMAQRRARTGGERIVPPGLNAEEEALWLECYDAEKNPHGLAPDETLNPETGEVTADQPASGWDEPQDGHAKPGQVYHLAEEPPFVSGRRATYIDGKPHDTAGPKDGVAVYREHAPAAKEGGRGPEESKSPPSSEGSPGLEAAIDAIAPIADWTMLKRAYRAHLRERWYLDAESEGMRMFRLAAWERLMHILPGNALGIASDYDAMWLWLEFGAKDSAEIDGMWPAFWRSRAYSTATPDEQAAIAALMIDRQKALKR